MAEQDGGAEVVSFMAEQFKRLNERFDRLEARFDDRFKRLEERMDHLERRQTASMHFEQAVLAHLTGINERIDNLRGELLGFDRRLK
ncbi:MAG: hypothetical protein JO290_13975, partial [Sphingomonadaceae bacterium]|nr:hypothetical protein [Sphingomonadaceae bacterium]